MARTNPAALFLLACLAAGCVSPEAVRRSPAGVRPQGPEQRALLDEAEAGASPEGRRILETARRMIADGEIHPGACWDYIDNVYNRAGFPDQKRQTVYMTRKRGPYANVNLFRSGDWLYLVNHGYGGIEHSAIFVHWIDREERQALMVSYAGENRKTPGRYVSYDLTGVYAIIRPVPLKRN